MAKFKKFISIIALAIFTLTFLVGCSLFVRNEDRYREQTAMTIGNEVVTLGEVIDYFDANGTVYVQQGYSYQQVWDMLFPVFVQQKVMLDAYKTSNTATNTSDLAKQIGGNAGYIKDDSTLEYVQKSVYYAFYQSLDSLTIAELEENFTFEEVANDEFADMIDRGDNFSPATADKYLDIDALNEKMAEYPAQDYKSLKYTFAKTDDQVAKIVSDLNERLVKDSTDDKDVTVEDYIKAQERAVSTMTKNIKNNKDMTVDAYIAKTICEQVDAQIANEYLNTIYAGNQDKISKDIFDARLAVKKAEAVATYSQNPAAFESFITNLTDEDFVYYVPQQYQGQYYYVRSILIAFDDEQTELLNLAKSRYGASSSAYKTYRDTLAQSIVVKNSDGQTEDIMNVASEILAITTKADFLTATYKYNTDAGMKNPVHSYVVSKEPTDLGFAGTSFVQEFVEAARQMINAGESVTACITDYGIHFIFNDGKVVADTIDYSQRDNYDVEGGSASWRFYQEIYAELKDMFADKQIAALYDSYLKADKVSFEVDVIASYAETIDVVYEG